MDPRKGVEMFLVVLLPRVADLLVPLFKGIGIRFEIGMLAPPLEVLDALEALIEAEDHAIRIVLRVWGHLQPVLLDVGHN